MRKIPPSFLNMPEKTFHTALKDLQDYIDCDFIQAAFIAYVDKDEEDGCMVAATFVPKDAPPPEEATPLADLLNWFFSAMRDDEETEVFCEVDD